MKFVKYRIEHVIDRSADINNEIPKERKIVEREFVIDDTKFSTNAAIQQLFELLKHLAQESGYEIE
ncbi:MAG: hypothetical protein QXU32_06680 [Nitrososphaerales archaeon]